MNPNTQASPPPLPLPVAPETLNLGTLLRVSCWYHQDLDDNWKPLAGPFYPGEEFEAELLEAHLRQVEKTWSVLVRTDVSEFFIYRHACELDPFVVKSNSVFVRNDLAEWRKPIMEHWAERGTFRV